MVEKPDGTHVAVFHAVDKALHPDADYTGAQPVDVEAFRRSIYAVPMRLGRTGTGVPTIELVDDPARVAAP